MAKMKTFEERYRDEILSGLKELCAAYGCDISVLGI